MMSQKTRQTVRVESIQSGDEVITGHYDTFNEKGDDVRKPIYEVVSGIILSPASISVMTAENPHSPLSYDYGEMVTILR